MHWISRSIVAGFAACGILMAVIAFAGHTAPRAERIAHPGGLRMSLASIPGLPSHDAQPGTIPDAVEPEDDPEPPASDGSLAGALCKPATRPASLAPSLTHASFAAPRSVPLRA
jgi:hypothetical protein